jgi:hypothetical protein
MFLIAKASKPSKVKMNKRSLQIGRDLKYAKKKNHIGGINNMVRR